MCKTTHTILNSHSSTSEHGKHDDCPQIKDFGVALVEINGIPFYSPRPQRINK